MFSAHYVTFLHVLHFILQRECMSYMALKSCNLYIDEAGGLLVVCGDFTQRDHENCNPWYEPPDERNRRAMIIDVSFRAALFHIHN